MSVLLPVDNAYERASLTGSQEQGPDPRGSAEIKKCRFISKMVPNAGRLARDIRQLLDGTRIAIAIATTCVHYG